MTTNEQLPHKRPPEEGDGCDDCNIGKLAWQSIHSNGCCSCHISPPCSYCTDQDLACDKCGKIHAEYEPPKVESHISNGISLTQSKTAEERFRELPEGVFGYIKYPNDGWGMAVKGKMPDGMSKEEVLKNCGVCKYGIPSFKYFGIGQFLFTYNYD